MANESRAPRTASRFYLGDTDGMRAVVQRVKEARVEVNESRVSGINTGLLVYLGVQQYRRARGR